MPTESARHALRVGQPRILQLRLQHKTLWAFWAILMEIKESHKGYRPFLEQAERAGWPVRTFDAGHFHMLVDPAAVARALVDLIQQMRAEYP